MTIYLIAVTHVLHECPGQQDAHPYDTRRTILAVTPGRACLSPVTIRVGDTTATIPCGKREPSGRQCRNCRNIITYSQQAAR